MSALTAFRTGTRAATAGAVLGGRRQARADAGLLAFGAVVLALSVALSLAIPRLVAQASDEAVRGAVRDAGTSADLVTRLGAAPGAGTRSSTRDPNVAASLRDFATDVRDAMPPALGAVAGPGSVSVATSVRVAVAGETPIATRLVYVGVPDTERQAALVSWVAGAAPGLAEQPGDDDRAPDGGLPSRQLQVGLQADAAADLGVHVGDRVHGSLPSRGPVDIVVTGLYDVTDPDDPAWTGFEDLVAKQEPRPGTGQEGRVALLVTDDSLPDLELVVPPRSLVTSYRYPSRAEQLDATTAPRVRADLLGIQADASILRQLDGRTPKLSTALGAELAAVEVRLAAARAQQSVLVVGLAGVGALVLVLAARLLISRRESTLLTERARGASLVAVAARTFVESGPAALAAGLLGAAVAVLVAGGGSAATPVAVGLVVVGALAPVVIAVGRARTAWSGRREPANRADRDRLLRRRSARRLVAEAALVVLAVGAVVSVRGRGLLAPGAGDVDLLLAAAPLLAAAAVTVVAVHVIPPLLRTAGRVAQRGRGLVGVVATARASAVHGAAVPLTALTMALAMVVFCGTTVATVHTAQAAVADVRVGADVRVDGQLTQQDVDALRRAPGVTQAAGIAVNRSRSLGSGSGATVDIVLVDAAALAAIDAAHGRDDGFSTLATGSGVPAQVDAKLARTVQLMSPRVLGDSGDVDLDVVGTVSDGSLVGAGLSGSVVRPRVVVDRATFDATQQEPSELSTILVDGPGAAAAVAAQHLDERPDVAVTTRDDWLAAWTRAPLNHGLVVALLAAGAVFAVYAALALVLLLVATSGGRRRTLSALRTLGLDARTARALSVAELAPLAGAGLLAGIAIGLGVPRLLSGALGLAVATGGSHPPPVSVAWWPLVAATVTVVVTLVVAVAVEGAVRRRENLGDVLRLGER